MRPLELALAIIDTFQLVPHSRRRATGDEIATSTFPPDSLGAAR